MAASKDPKTGYSSQTKTYYSLRPATSLPPPTQPLSLAQYVFSLLRSSSTDLSSVTFAIDSITGLSLTYSRFIEQINSLALSLKEVYSLGKNDVAFVLCPQSFNVPVIYLALLCLGVTVCPANPLGSDSEVAHQVQLTKPKIAFAYSSAARKIPPLPHGTIIVDSPEFSSLLTRYNGKNNDVYTVEVAQSDTAAILFSSGTTGRVKGVSLSHRNFIALLAGLYHNNTTTDSDESEPQPVLFMTLPFFHVYGFFMLVRSVALAETLVLMERFDFEGMLKAVERYKVTSIPVSPPLIVALVKSDLPKKYDMSSLMGVGSGGAALGKEVAEKFREMYPNVELIQGYGLTETVGAATRTLGPEESERYGSVGRLSENLEAKIVDPATGEALPPGQRGELWLRGPTIMKGYVGDEQATVETIDSEGWLKTGDLCYFDSDGLLYIVDRLKELIKYNAYQVPPAELEELLLSHPSIADVAVIPYPDEEAGQIPMAFIVRKPGHNISESEVIDFVAKQVAPYKKIRRVAFISAIPKNPAGKILRRELVQQALSAASSKL